MTLPTVVWVPSPKFTTGHPASLLALVHHRMVGTLPGTDALFSRSDGRAASTNFGIGHKSGRLEVHQYVRLGDQAWGNGNWDASGQWNDRYPVTNLNSRTVSIEHEDNGGLPSGDPRRGIVTEDILAASIELDRLLLTGNVAAIEAAGIRFRDGTAIGKELDAIKPGPNTIIDHHYIAGSLKPSCWRPWAADKTGFPQARFIAALATAAPPPPATPEEPMNSFTVPEQRTTVTLKEDPARPGNSAWMFTTSACVKDGTEISLAPIRPLVLVGFVSVEVAIVAYELSGADADTSSKTYFVRATDIARTSVVAPPVVAADCTAAIAAAVGPINVRLTASEAAVAAATARIAAIKTKTAAFAADVSND